MIVYHFKDCGVFDDDDDDDEIMMMMIVLITRRWEGRRRQKCGGEKSCRQRQGFTFSVFVLVFVVFVVLLL